MRMNSVSFGYSTDKLQETKLFYEKYFDAKTVFEADGYMNLLIGNLPIVLEFSSPAVTGMKKSDCLGIGFNIDVDDVKSVYDDMVSKGVDVVMPLQEHPWGEVGFGIQDPNGLTIYICMKIEV